MQHHAVLRDVLNEKLHTPHIVKQIRLVIGVQVDDVELLRLRRRRRGQCVVVGLVLAQSIAVRLGRHLELITG